MDPRRENKKEAREAKSIVVVMDMEQRNNMSLTDPQNCDWETYE